MKGFKKYLALAAISCLSTSVYAGWEYNTLLGVSGGYITRDGDVNVTMFGPAPLSPLVTSFNRDVGDDGFIGGVFGGFQARCNRLLLGAELAIDWEDTDDDLGFATTLLPGTPAAVAFTGTTNYDRGTTFGLTARAGYALAKYFLLYLRAGAEWSRDRLSVNAATPVTAPMPLSYAAFGKHDVTRFVGGIGFEVPVPISYMPGLSFRAEYNYHSEGHAVNARGFDGAFGSVLIADAKPRMHSGKASLVLNFL